MCEGGGVSFLRGGGVNGGTFISGHEMESARGFSYRWSPESVNFPRPLNFGMFSREGRPLFRQCLCQKRAFLLAKKKEGREKG